MIPLVIRKCLRSLLLNYLSKLYYSSELFPALPLSLRRGGWGVRLFFSPKKKGRRKIIFYIFPFYLYSFLSPPSFSSPLRAYPQGYCCICSPPCMGGGVGKRLLGDLYLLTNVDWTDAIHLKLFWSVSSISISNSR